jgi:prevent-host-death family protein
MRRSTTVTKRMTAREARDNFSDLLGVVYYGNEPVIVERKGKPVAVVISPEQYERYEHQVDQRFRDAVDELRRRNADKDPDADIRDVTEVVEEVRRDQYEREHSTQ